MAPGEVAPRRQLPSFVYLAGEIDLAPHETRLPWHDPQGKQVPVVGELARSQGARMASRMIASAKSWLCHPGVDRQAPILPWGEGDGPKLSPVAAAGADPRPRPAGVGPRASGRAVRGAGGAGDGAGVVRRGGARADAAGGGEGGVPAGGAARGAAGGVLRVDRPGPGRRAGAARAGASECWCSTWAAARRTSR